MSMSKDALRIECSKKLAGSQLIVHTTILALVEATEPDLGAKLLLYHDLINQYVTNILAETHDRVRTIAEKATGQKTSKYSGILGVKVE